jgi:hypothetical protein
MVDYSLLWEMAITEAAGHLDPQVIARIGTMASLDWSANLITSEAELAFNATL